MYFVSMRAGTRTAGRDANCGPRRELRAILLKLLVQIWTSIFFVHTSPMQCVSDIINKCNDILYKRSAVNMSSDMLTL